MNSVRRHHKMFFSLALAMVLTVGIVTVQRVAANHDALSIDSFTPTSQTVTAGGSTSAYTLTGHSIENYRIDFRLRRSDLPGGVQYDWSDGFWNNKEDLGEVVPAGGDWIQTLRLRTNGSTTLGGTYTFTIEVTACPVSDWRNSIGCPSSSDRLTTSMATLVVRAFTVAVAPSIQNVMAGQQASYTVTVTGQNGFDGTVDLSVLDLPAGASAEWPEGSSANLRTDVASFTKPLTITPQADAAIGTAYGFTVQASGSGVTAATSALYTVVSAADDFTVAVVPSSLTVARNGQSGVFTVTVQAIGGFSGDVTLSTDWDAVPTDVTTLWNGDTAPSTTVRVSAGESTTAQLQFSAGANASPGSFPFRILGVSGGTTRSSPQPDPVLTVEVGAVPDYGITAEWYDVDILAGQVAGFHLTFRGTNGISGNATFGVEWREAYTGDVSWDGHCSLNKGGQNTGAACTSDDQCADVCQGINNRVVFGEGILPGVVFLTVPTSGFDLPGTTYQFRVKATHATAGERVAPSDGSYFTIRVVGEGESSNLRLSVSPSTATVLQGESTTFRLTVYPQNSFSGEVALAVQGCPDGATCSYADGSTITLPGSGPGGSVTKEMTVQTRKPETIARTYTIVFLANDGESEASVGATLTVNEENIPPDFSITSITPNPLTLDRASSGTYTVTIERTGTFTGPVTIDWTATPTP